MKKYRFKKRFYVIAVTAGLLITSFSIIQIDRVCGDGKIEIPVAHAQAAVIERVTTPVSFNEVSEPEEPELISLGEFTITHYCRENYPHICNDGDATRTATGTEPTPGRTIAVDPDVIPYGSEVMINGHTYIAEDTGGAINQNRIDIAVDTHAEALQKGLYSTEVFLIQE